MRQEYGYKSTSMQSNNSPKPPCLFMILLINMVGCVAKYNALKGANYSQYTAEI